MGNQTNAPSDSAIRILAQPRKPSLRDKLDYPFCTISGRFPSLPLYSIPVSPQRSPFLSESTRLNPLYAKSHCSVIHLDKYPGYPILAIGEDASPKLPARICIYDVYQNMELGVLSSKQCRFGVSALCGGHGLGQASRVLVSGTKASHLCVWNWHSGECLLELPRPPVRTRRIVRFSRNQVVVGGYDSLATGTSMIRYDIETGSAVAVYRQWSPNASVRVPSVRASVYGISRVTTSGFFSAEVASRSLRMWDTNSNECVAQSLLASSGYSVYFDERKGRVFVGQRRGIEVWDARNLSSSVSFFGVHELDGTNEFVRDVRDIARARDDTFVGLNVEGCVFLWNPETLKTLQRAHVGRMAFQCCVIGAEEDESLIREELDEERFSFLLDWLGEATYDREVCRIVFSSSFSESERFFLGFRGLLEEGA